MTAGTGASGAGDARTVIFLLSPANLGGARAAMLFSPRAAFPLAARLRDGGVPIGEVYSFVSGLYFRGKLAYATRFGVRPRGSAALVIAPGAGLVPPSHPVGRADLEAMARVPVDAGEPRYREPLERAARELAAGLGPAATVVLLGSIASGKYADVLADILPALRFPAEFVGRGDMSRGGLMLRRVAEGRPLETLPLAGAVRRGKRPPRLEPLPRS